MFSVIIPIYNHSAYLAEAVCSALHSGLVSEVLLLDDGSRDGSRNLAAKWARTNDRIRDLTPAYGGNRGAHHRLNELVAAARCDWIAVLNSDDVFVRRRFEHIIAERHFSDSDFIFGNMLLMDDMGRLAGIKRGPFDTSTPFPEAFDVPEMVAAGDFLDLLSHQNYIGTTSNMLFTKKLHARIGGFSGFRYVHDWDFALRAIALGRALYVKRFVTTYRFHHSNTIRESALKVDLESREVFGRFTREFPEIGARPRFRLGLKTNVNVASLVEAART